MEALQNGAAIIDVRTVYEYDQGRIRGSINIPVERLDASIERIKAMRRPLIICAAGDARSGKAASLLKRNGLKEVYNGGNWEKLVTSMKGLIRN